MQDYTGNSKKSRRASTSEQEKVVEKVVTGEVVRREKPISRKFRDIFFSGSFKTSVKYVMSDILLPAARNTMSDATKSVVDRMIFGDTAVRRPPTPYGGRFSYNGISRATHPMHRGTPPDQPPRTSRSNSREANEIILQSKEEAQLVLERLNDIVDQYEVASLADLYELVGLPSAHVDNKWGWTYMSSATVHQIRDGWLLDLPPLEPI